MEGDSHREDGMKGSQALEKCDFVKRADWHTVLTQLDPLGSPGKFLA